MDRVYLNDLFDIYKSLLNKHEWEVFQNYYQDDLTLSEISVNNDVTRSAISKTLNNIISKLNDYEDKLHIYHKRKTIIRYLDNKDYDSIRKIVE